MMQILNVAGDNTAAKSIAGHLSTGYLKEREGLSPKNKIYEFETLMEGQQSKMIMTSVSEHHLMNHKFRYNKWSDNERKLLSLFDTPIEKLYDTRYTAVKRTLEREVKTCQTLIIWTYCDPEGENTGFEVIQICQDVKPNIKVYRARFLTITRESVRQALDDLGVPNKTISDAVDVRRQLDLRIGVAFTRFQRMRLERNFPRLDLRNRVNYGSCLFPTLGFVVERFLDVEKFERKPFWAIRAIDTRDGIPVEFKWEKNRLSEELNCRRIFEKCSRGCPDATVEKVTSERKSKMRPLPLNTVELAKHCSDVFDFTVKKTMDIAMDLYEQGLISYPQTGTNKFPDDLQLELFVKQLIDCPEWGPFAQQLLKDGPSPRQGTKSDGAHSPIYPTEKISANLKGDEAKVYEFIVRRFLACLSGDAEFEETIVVLKIADEKFEASGLRVTLGNYLEVYPYENLRDMKIFEYKEGQILKPAIEIVSGVTSPPDLLTESDLITLKEEHRIGTDSSHADHIESIKLKRHVKLDGKYLTPTGLGLALVMGYDSVESRNKMWKPDLRKKLDDDLKLICDGAKLPAIVLRDHLDIHRAILTGIFKQSQLFDVTVAKYLNRRD